MLKMSMLRLKIRMVLVVSVLLDNLFRILVMFFSLYEESNWGF